MTERVWTLDAHGGTPLEVIDLGRRSFEEVYELQRARLDARIRGEVPNTLFLVEHDAVVTRGRRSAEGDTAGVEVPVVSLERGGEATYHGPGQLVAYAIIELPEGRRDLHRYLRDLEGVVMDALDEFGIEAGRSETGTGVWIGSLKVCSVGVAVRRWVTWHGLALNVTTHMDAFQTFRPCGLSPEVMTRVVDHLPGGADVQGLFGRVKDAVARAFAARF